ncbi:MAG: hypothetical protein RIE06_18890 [Roseibium album]|uniref:hypothetical protein n=1 Tax=Roseibium album TaxID=311410 RepID=UPI0032ED5BE0
MRIDFWPIRNRGNVKPHMRFERPFAGRMRLYQTADIAEINVRAKFDAFGFASFSFFVFVWTASGVLSAQSILTQVGERNVVAPLLGLSAFWMLLFLFFAIPLMWTLTGNERLTVSRNNVAIRYSIKVFGWTWRYAPSRITNIRRNAEEPAFSDLNHLAEPFDGRGRVAFKYGRKTVNFGKRLANEEADQVVAAIKRVLRVESEES